MKQNTRNFLKAAIENKFNLFFLEVIREGQETEYRQLIQKQIQKINTKTYGDNICIVLDKGLGDFLLFAYYFEVLIEYYRRKGKNVYVLCDHYNVKFLDFCRCPLPNIILIESNKEMNHVYQDLIAEYYNFFETVILPLDWIGKYHCNLIRQLNPKKIYSVGNKTYDTRRVSLSDREVLSKVQVLPGTDKGFYAERHRIVADNLTGETHDLRLIEIEAGERIIEREYYVINIGSSGNQKVWPIEKVISLVGLLGDKLNAKPIVVGNADPEKIDQLETVGIDCSFANVMDIKKTISLCSHAKFVITNETGLYHLSVCLKKRTYVISAGNYDERFFPYPEKLQKEKVEYIVPDKTCENCTRHWACFVNRKKGITFECLDEISPQQVFEALKEEYDLNKDQ
jgi:ADP-heptose:LPS heptosyltransferase